MGTSGSRRSSWWPVSSRSVRSSISSMEFTEGPAKAGLALLDFLIGRAQHSSGGGVRMARKVFGLVIGASLGVAVTVVPAWAHHAFAAAFDANALVTVQGVITEVK